MDNELKVENIWRKTFSSVLFCFIITLITSDRISGQKNNCPNGLVTFELVTGHVFQAPSDTVTMLPGMLHLIECMERCLSNNTCKSVNFETGLCVLLSSSASERPEALTLSQFPVFTIYAQKICLTDKKKACNRGWAFERVKGFELKRMDRKIAKVLSREECMQLCLNEIDFECRSVNYDSDNNGCSLSDMDRHTINVNNDLRSRKYGPSSGTIDYMENNCIQEPTKLCDFRPINGKILKTVDSVYQNVKTIEECKDKCLNSPYRCHSFDFGDPSNSVCRTSHLDKNSLAHIENPYIEINGATTYEILSCYNVTILCRSREMVARIKTSKVFDGKIYAKTKPNLCVNDISNSLEFEIKMKYNDGECDVKQSSRGQFSNDIVIQHHDMIVTTRDLGLSIHCKYDLSNKSISNNVNLAVDGDVDSTGSHSATVNSPNVTMKITDRGGSDISSAQVGDPLLLRFSIVEKSSPYEIFVRELVAVDGADLSEILLIDSLGCPTDSFIMGAMNKVRGNGQILEAPFDAFKFPTSDIVQFKALVTPCLPSCEPIKCNSIGADGRTSEVHSFGRRRKRDTDEEQVLVMQSLSVSDKFGFSRNQRKLSDINDPHIFVSNNPEDEINNEKIGSCLNTVGVSLAIFVFLMAQTFLIIVWACLWVKKHHQHKQRWPTNITTSYTSDNFTPSRNNEFIYSVNKHF